MLLLLIAFLLPTLTAYGQENECVPASCSNLKVEVVRHANVSPTCSTGSVSCNDKFRQISYTVYLRHSKTVSQMDPLLPFDLEYDMLDIALSLQNLNNGVQFSHIDANATKACFDAGVGAKWNYNSGDGNKAIFTVTDKSANISFANLAPGSPDCGTTLMNNSGNKITFTYNPPPGLVDLCGQNGPPTIRCAYAELFTIVVNAYAGESNGLQFDQRTYLQSFAGSECTIEKVISGPNNGLIPITVLNPAHFTGTPNASILAQLLPPGAGGVNEKIFPIQIRNTGNSPVTVSYLEFMIRAMTVNIDQPFEYTIATPRESASGGGPGPAAKNLHYLIPNAGIMLNPNGTFIVGTIIVKTPTLSNLSWSAAFSFQDSGGHPSKSRIQTSDGCTSLNAAFVGSSDSNTGDALCSDPSVHFKVEGEGLTCGTSKVKVGLRTTSPPASIRLSKVEFELDFSWVAPGISITGVNYPNWPGIACSTFGCYTTPLNQKVCWEVSPNGQTSRYCYQTDDPNAPIFSLDDIANMEILFNTPENACIENVKISKLSITYVGSGIIPPCIPVIDPIAGFPLCGSATTMLTGAAVTETLQGISEVKMTLSSAVNDNIADNGIQDCSNVSCSPAACSPVDDLSDDNGVYLFSCTACTACSLLKVVPEKDDNPLNGVTTYDLVLIYKHILGTEPLNTPYKIIAADANKTGSITTFDIIALRKLILGIFTEFSEIEQSQKSWRFVDKAFPFPNPNNPFQTSFPEGINCIAFPAAGIDFTGLKVGDVNNTAMGNRPVERPLASLSWPNLRAEAGGTLTVPISYSGSEHMGAIQLGLRFDPGKLQLIGPTIGDIESYLPDNFNLLKAGEGQIQTLWLPMTDGDEKILPGSVLFNLTFKVLEKLPNSEIPLWLDNQLLDCAAWKPDGAEFAVQQAPTLTKRDDGPTAVAIDLWASILPNPTAGGATLFVQALKAEKSRFSLFDAFGHRLFMRELLLREGIQEIPLPEIAPIPSGVYIWKVYTPNLEVQGHLVKQ